jgi:hypothetical protein
LQAPVLHDAIVSFGGRRPGGRLMSISFVIFGSAFCHYRQYVSGADIGYSKPAQVKIHLILIYQRVKKLFSLCRKLACNLQYLITESLATQTEASSSCFRPDYWNELMDQVITRTNEAADIEQGDLTLPQVMGSVFAASFGVQSKENKLRDFKRGKPVHFIIAGLTFTVMFMATLVTVVNLVV